MTKIGLSPEQRNSHSSVSLNRFGAEHTKGVRMEFIALGILGIIVWYIGEHVNSMLEGAAKLASREFEVYEVDQEIRLAKERQEQLRKIERVLDNGPVPSTAELKSLLNGGKK